MKKILSILLILIMACGIFAGCSNTKESTNNETSQTVTENTNDTISKPTDQKDPTSSNGKEEVDEKEKYEQYLKDTKIELISISSGIPFDDLFKDGFYPADYDNKTSMIVIGITYANKEAYNGFYTITFQGETATDPNNPEKSAYQTLENAYTTDDKLYSIHIYNVQGTVDASKVKILIKTDNKEVFEERMFENNGQPVGYTNAIEKFSNEDDNMGLQSSILELKNRHYKVIHRGRTELDCIDMEVNHNKNGYDIIAEYRLSLLPIENNYKRTLKNEDIKLIGVPNNGIEYTVNVKDENIFGGNSRIHTSIYIEARKHYDSVPLKDDGYIDYSACKPLMNEVDETLKDISIEIASGDTVLSIPVKK